MSGVIWFDLVTPKSVMFFRKIISGIEGRGNRVLVTAREGLGYTEVVELLKLYKIPFINRGRFGGGDLGDKLAASIDRQRDLMNVVSDYNVSKLVCLCSVDANRVAFGLGMPIVNFYDIPLSDWRSDFKKALPQARLTLPLSTRAFHPYMVPRSIFERFSLESDQIFTYEFLDVLIWLQDFVADRSFFDNHLAALKMDTRKPTIIIREEEYKSSYVKKKYPLLYEGLKILQGRIDANFIFIPRYEPEFLEAEFPFAGILKEKLIVQHLLAFADLFIGGGGTLNSEACFFGTPTISTRSFVSHYDKLLIEEGLMEKADSLTEFVDQALAMVGKRRDAKPFFQSMNVDLNYLLDGILGA
ncbi:MAG: DUF354 domain-containing protein [Candidatus Ozemobacteraceae bacterium]